MSTRHVSWPRLIAAALCLVPAAGGVALLFHDSGAALGLGLVGFFGAGVVVFARQAFTEPQPGPSTRSAPPHR